MAEQGKECKITTHIFQQNVGIPMGSNCAPLLADLFLYSYEAEFIQNVLKSGKKKTRKTVTVYLTFRYTCIDDMLSLNNSKFSDSIDRIFPVELDIKDDFHFIIVNFSPIKSKYVAS